MVDGFFYAQPVKIRFGEGCFDKLGDVLDELGVHRAVLVSGRHFAPEAERLMAADGRFAAAFCAVEQNPQLSGVEETVRLCRAHKADAVIGIGGGSAMDTAKYAATVAPNAGDAIDYYRGERALDAASRLTIVAVPTTAGTGSEVTQVSVISHGSEKKTTNHPAFMPTAAVVDPLLTLGVPPRTTMNTGLDAIAHAIEGYWSVNHQPITDALAIEAVRVALANLEKAWRDGSDRDARSAMSYASLVAGLSFAQPKTAACHACSYPLSERYHLPHGEACAFTLDSFIRLNADERLEKLARGTGVKDCAALADRIGELKALAGLRRRLSELDGDVDVPDLAAACLRHPLMNNNPRKFTQDELIAMFEALR